MILLKAKTPLPWLMESIERGYIFLTTFQILLPILTFSVSLFSQTTRSDCFELSRKQADRVQHQVGSGDPF